MPEPVWRNDYGQVAMPRMTKSIWSITKRGAPRFSPRRRLKKAATMSPSIAPRARARRMEFARIQCQRTAGPGSERSGFAGAPSKCRRQFRRCSSESFAVAQGSRPSWKVWPDVQGHASAEERCEVVGDIGGQHQPEGNYQDIHYSYSDCPSRSHRYIKLSDEFQDL